ncbi:hypothetical protein CAEBREN_24117 [Caenorhabditis brenneri]|uniref:Endonuclease/exonuclease/phosphatase domain-containing protein n=1 Tax=Caenorhabditis brenneri TaxID=135651 RepID=G0PMQ2_CAEBE|nr:hypothetical protein CAEBREN_24117 [Caenorhabditis brenneri]
MVSTTNEQKRKKGESSEETAKKKPKKNKNQVLTEMDLELIRNSFLEMLENDRFKSSVANILKDHFEMQINPKIVALEKELKEQMEKVAILSSELEALAEKVGELEKGRNEVIGETKSEKRTAEEIERKRSVVISGVPEGGGSNRASWNWDSMCVGKIFSYLDMGAPPVSVYRLGRSYGNGRRLMKVVLMRSKDQEELLRRAPRLKNFPSLGIPVYIRPSMTREEREKMKLQRGQIKCSVSSRVKDTNSPGTEVNYLLERKNYDIICFQETWLTPDTPISIFADNLGPRSYSLFRTDRSDGRGGGVGIFCKGNLKSKIILSESVKNGYEILALELNLGVVPFQVFNVYRAPSCNPEKTKKLFKTIVTHINSDSQIVIVGDFNLKEIDWQQSPPVASTSLAGQVISFCESNDLNQFVQQPTRGNNILDLVFSNRTITKVSISSPVADHFVSQYINKRNNGFSIPQGYESEQPVIWVTDDEIFKNLSKIKPNNTLTPDGVPAKFLKMISVLISSPISQLCNYSMMTGLVPRKWKESLVLPLKKIDNPIHISEFRPISITSVICRTYERCLLKNISHYLSYKNFFDYGQHGFRPRRSTTTCVLEALNEWTDHYDNGEQTDVIYFDFKAVHAISKWADEAQLELNKKKTFSISIGKKPANIQYFLGNDLILRQNVVRDLGFLISGTLDFKEHWQAAIRKANYSIHTLFKTFSSSNSRLLILLFKIFVRPLLEYGTVVSNPFNKNIIKSIESVQSNFTRRVLFRNAGRRLSRTESDYLTADQRLLSYGLEPLVERRERLDKIFFTKLMLDKIDIDYKNYFHVSLSKTRRGRRYHWKRPKTRIKEHFFTNRILSRIVNQTSLDIRPH